ncbi:MAG: Transglutaminase-like superfamily protein, partial [Mucilaginibacter sp.]|nr:Transglutaminase-like superfamily protein [Mucilaginibacter sp.]
MTSSLTFKLIGMLKFWSWVLMLFLFLSCNNKNDTPSTDTERLNLALHFAGGNSAELRKVLDHYSSDRKDSLKLRAAYFLINNMIGKGYSQYQEVNSFGSCSYDLFSRSIGIDSICYFKKRYEDSTHSGKILFTKPVFKEDIKSIKSSELIENIDFAFLAWKLPWAKTLTFGEFEEFVLPYRVEKEPLQNWRKYFFMNSKWILDRAGATTDRIKIAGIINDSLKRRYKYTNDAISFFPGTFTLKELNASGGGRCGDLNTIAAYWLRAIGIPTASEFSPFWSNSNYGGHSWLSVLDGNGKFVPMNAVYDNPVRDSLPFKDAYLAKAYRWKYAMRPGFYT